MCEGVACVGVECVCGCFRNVRICNNTVCLCANSRKSHNLKVEETKNDRECYFIIYSLTAVSLFFFNNCNNYNMVLVLNGY